MKRTAAIIGILLSTLTSISWGQYNKLPASQPFVPIANAPGAVAFSSLTGLSSCWDCFHNFPLSFQFPWFRGRPVGSLWIGPNGAIGIGGPVKAFPSLYQGLYALDNGETGTSRIMSPPVARIALIYGRVYLARPGEIWILDDGNSVIVSYEEVYWGNGGTATFNAQAEIFPSGDIELRYGSLSTSGGIWGVINFSAGLTTPESGPSLWASPSPILPEFNAIGLTSGGVSPQYTGVRFEFTVDPNYQVNLPEASLLIDGKAATIDIPALTTSCQGLLNTFNFRTSTPSAPGDMLVSSGPIAPRVAITAGNQVINIDPAFPATWLNGGTSVSLRPSSNFSYPFVPVSTYTASIQGVVLNPSHVDGFSLSQASQVDTAVSNSGGPQVLPLGASGRMRVDFASFPNCGPTSIPFYGTSYTSLTVLADGRIGFGPGVWSTANYTPVEAQALAPSFGFATDFIPSPTTMVSAEVTPTEVHVVYSNVFYGGQAS